MSLSTINPSSAKMIAQYFQNECTHQGSLFAGIIAIESRICNMGEIVSYRHDTIDSRRLQVVINMCGVDMLTSHIAYIRRCIYANEQATYLRTNRRIDYFVFSPTKLIKHPSRLRR